MSLVKIQGNASGTGEFTIAAPNSNTNRTLTLPDATGTVVTDSATQTLTNKTLGSGLVAGASLITSGTSVASTSGTSIDFTGIPSWVKRITILLHRVSTTGTVPLLYQLGTSGGIVTTGYVSSGTYQGAGSGGTQSTSGMLNAAGGAVTDTSVGLTTICNFSGNTWVSCSVSGDGNADYSKTAGGSVTLSGTLDRIRITTTTGTPTFDAGSINILYE
jgi:hypothetical protein